GTADRNRSHWSTSKTPSYTKSVSWQHHLDLQGKNRIPRDWGNDGAVWAKLRERDADSIFAATREAILAVHEKLDMDLLR
nr:hypothetical protein [Escherichia coli]